MGYIYFKLKQKQKAFVAYEKALKYDKDDIDTWLEYANVLESIEIQKAQRSYLKALELMKLKAKSGNSTIQPEIYINIGVL